mgnify:CR=1 FL=1
MALVTSGCRDNTASLTDSLGANPPSPSCPLQSRVPQVAGKVNSGWVRLIALCVASLWESAPPGNPQKKGQNVSPVVLLTHTDNGINAESCTTMTCINITSCRSSS